jgi:manganese/zinc/iron transport system permease protein
LTKSLRDMVIVSVLLAAAAAVIGHWAAITIPAWFGYSSTTTAGMIAVVSGVGFLLAMLASSEGLSRRLWGPRG